jgi:uncharacterized protein with HEPN domain
MSDISRVADYLRHAVDACDRIVEYTRGQTLAEFLGSRLVQDAVLRNFEVLGEAIVQLRDEDPALLGRYPDVDWQDTIAFRNRLIHGYASVNFSIVWDTVRDDLPRLRSQLQAIAEEVDPKA